MTRVAGGLIGVVFGVTLCWSAMSNPDVVRSALLIEDSYLYLMFASAVATSAAGLALVRRGQRRTLLTGEPIGWSTEQPGRDHVVGSLIFGLGWGVTGVCPGPIATQVGQGIGWALFTLVGVVVGVYVFVRRERPETEPAFDLGSAQGPRGVPSARP